MKKMTPRRAIRKSATYLSWWLQDLIDSVFGGRDPLVPPRLLDHNKNFDGGELAVELLRRHAALQPTDRVLDVGCGTGRVAAKLTKYLSSDGSYVGLDIVEPAVKWMQKSYAGNHPNFAFHHLDVHNSAYNPGGKYSADTVQFPLPADDRFDVVFLFSVFTHMYPQHMKHYLKLIADRLKPGGRMMASVFINDDFAQEQQRKSIETGQKLAKRIFRQKAEDYYAPGKTNPEFAVAYDLEQLARVFADTGLKIEPPFHYGFWCNRPGGSAFYQDILIATRI